MSCCYTVSPFQTARANIYTRINSYRERLDETHSHSASILLCRAIRHHNTQVHEALPVKPRIELWLDNVMLHMQNEEMEDPDTSDEAPEDVWAGPTSPPKEEEEEEENREKAWKDRVSER